MSTELYTKLALRLKISMKESQASRIFLTSFGIRPFFEGESSNPAAEGGESSNPAAEGIRLASQTEVDEHFVGMEDDIKALIKLLVEEKNESTHGIISIIAIGGSGKTTLAKKIYNHHKIKSCFEAFAWVCVTERCQPRSVMRDMLKQLDPQNNGKEINNMEYEDLVQRVYAIQNDKKCLVVVDDIWKVDDWKTLSPCFRKDGRNSRVLLTTRNKDVAEIGFPYQPKALTETEGLQLLRRVAFPRASTEENILVDSDQFERIGRATVRKCGYLPLAIVMVGGILKGNRDFKDLQSINRQIDSFLMWKGTGKDKGKDVLQQVLALSYNGLPYYLQQCFLYFGCFEEDEDIDTKRLYNLWIAEGMISSNHRESKETMRDVSERYLEELARRGVVEVEKSVESNEDGQFKSCRLQGLTHGYCVRKCKEENFLDVMDKGGVVNDPDHPFKNSCRLTMNINPDNVEASCSIPAERISIGLRSLQIVGRFGSDPGNDKIPPAIWSVERFKLLRTLVINGYNFRGKSLDGMEKLIHLRYLGLTWCESVTFPSSIVKLSYLKILDLTGTHLTEYPTKIHRLGGIWYLYLPILIDNQPNRIFSFDYLQQLEILIGVSSKYHDFTDLSALKNLRILAVTVEGSKTILVPICYYLNTAGNNLTYGEVTVKDVRDLDSVHVTQILTCRNLHVLTFRECHVQGWPDHVQCLQLSSSIEQLNFYHTEIFNDPMPILEKLPNLKVLKFERSTFSWGGEEMSCDAGGFPQLVDLTVFCTQPEFHLRIDEGAMLNLGSLHVSKSTVLAIPDKPKCIVTTHE